MKITDDKIEIYFSDLNVDAQKYLLKAYNISKPEDFNYDVVPIAVMEDIPS